MLRNCLPLLCVWERRLVLFRSIENLSTSRIWKFLGIQKLVSRPVTETAILDQCSFGLTDPVSAAFYKKCTIVLGTLPDLYKLSRKCPDDHVCQHVESSLNVGGVSVKRSVTARRYLVEMCKELANIVSVAVFQATSARALRVSRQFLQ